MDPLSGGLTAQTTFTPFKRDRQDARLAKDCYAALALGTLPLPLGTCLPTRSLAGPAFAPRNLSACAKPALLLSVGQSHPAP